MVEGRTGFAVLPVGWWLERDVVGSFSLSLVTVRAIAEQAKLPCYDFSPIAFAASVLGLVLAGGEPTLDVDLAAFGKNLLAGVREFYRTQPRDATRSASASRWCAP